MFESVNCFALVYKLTNNRQKTAAAAFSGMQSMREKSVKCGQAIKPNSSHTYI